jgi:uncharacterized protein
LKVLQQPFLLPVDDGRCFCIYREPADGPVLGTVLHLPAFGDEMNKSRAMTARAARAFARLGFGVLQVDLTGCGDSAGNHADATLARWGSDLRHALAWLRARVNGEISTVLWSLRSGALLIPSLLSGMPKAPAVLLWQPVLSGSQQVRQLLRQKLATDMATPSGRSRTRELRKLWEAGKSVEVGGYSISAQLANELDECSFDVPANFDGSIEWLEVSPASPARLSPAADSKIGELRSRGVNVSASALTGPGFWQSVEIERCDTLVDASTAFLGGMCNALRRDTADV